MNQYNILNVLVVSGGGYQGLTVIKGLKETPQTKIILADCYSENVCKYFCDSFYVVPKIINENYFFITILDICKKESVKLIIPSTELELAVLSKKEKHFQERGIQVAVSNHSLLKILLNKKSTHQFLVKNKYPVIPLVDLKKPNDSFPIIGKPLQGFGGKGFYEIDSLNELNKIHTPSLEKNYIWQPKLNAFEEYSIDFACGINGKPSKWIIRKRNKTFNGFAIICEKIDDTKIDNIISNLQKTLISRGGKGIFNVQILKTQFNYFISDINPRIGTSSIFALGCGLNLPRYICDSISEQRKKNLSPKNPVQLKMVRYLEELWIEPPIATNVKGIIFDLDDTLFDQKKWIFEKLKFLFFKMKKHLPNEAEFIGKSLSIIEEGNRSYIFDALAIEYGFNKELKVKLIETYRKIVPEGDFLYEEVLASILELKKRGYALGILTDNPPISQKQKIAACQLNGVLDSIVYTNKHNTEKPHAKAFNMIAQKIKIHKEHLIMVGDNLYRDIHGAVKANYAGAYFIRRQGGFFNYNENIFNEIQKSKLQYKTINSIRNLLNDLPPVTNQ